MHVVAARCGQRLLALDGNTLSAAAAAARQLALLERATGVGVAQLFDVVGGAGFGGVLALALGVRCRAAAGAPPVALRASA